VLTLSAQARTTEVIAALEDARRHGRDLTRAFEPVGEAAINSIVANFEEGGRPEPWKPSRRAQREGGKTLIKDGILVGSFTSDAFPNRAEVWTNVPYAAIMHEGGTIPAHKVVAREGGALAIPVGDGVIFRKSANIPEAKIPARPFMMLQEEDWPVIEGHIMDEITGGLDD